MSPYTTKERDAIASRFFVGVSNWSRRTFSRHRRGGGAFALAKAQSSEARFVQLSSYPHQKQGRHQKVPVLFFGTAMKPGSLHAFVFACKNKFDTPQRWLWSRIALERRLWSCSSPLTRTNYHSSFSFGIFRYVS